MNSRARREILPCPASTVSPDQVMPKLSCGFAATVLKS